MLQHVRYFKYTSVSVGTNGVESPTIREHAARQFAVLPGVLADSVAAAAGSVIITAAFTDVYMHPPRTLTVDGVILHLLEVGRAVGISVVAEATSNCAQGHERVAFAVHAFDRISAGPAPEEGIVEMDVSRQALDIVKAAAHRCAAGPPITTTGNVCHNRTLAGRYCWVHRHLQSQQHITQYFTHTGKGPETMGKLSL